MGKDIKGKELGVGICQRKDGLYVGRFRTRSGKTVQKCFKKLQECRHWIEEERKKKNDIIYNLPNLTMDEWYSEWIKTKEKTIKSGSVYSYQYNYRKHIQPVIGDILLSELKPVHCQCVLTDMADAGYSTKTIGDIKTLIYNILEQARDNDIILTNPCKKSVKANIGKKNPPRVALSIDNQKKFLESIVGHRYENAYRFLLQTGLRAGELEGLKWEDIDFKEKTLSVKRQVQRNGLLKKCMPCDPKSEAGKRIIPLTDEAIRILKEQKELNRKNKIQSLEWNGYIFLGERGNPTGTNVYNVNLKKICGKNGLPQISMHILRHTFATRCVEAGIQPKTLQIIMGHSTLAVTMNLYVHVTDDQKKKEMEKVENALMVM